MFRANHMNNSRKPWQRLLIPGIVIASVCVLLLTSGANANHNSPHGVAISAAQPSTAVSGAAAYTVPVTLYVMSQCPDAKFCQQAFKPVLETLPSLITIKTQYIASYSDKGEVTCMHGTAECEGNKQQLCLQQQLTAADNRKFFETLLCHSGGDVSNAQHLQTCMGSAGISADTQAKVLQCASGTEGPTLQLASAKDVNANGVRRSCTVFIDGAKSCIRDGNRWYDCTGGSDTQAFVQQICEAYKKKASQVPPECKAALGQSTAPAQ